MVTRLRRYGQIIDILVKYGFSVGADALDPDGSRRRKFHKNVKQDERSVYERARLALQELGPTFVKFGQIMASRGQSFPPEFIEEMKKLHDEVGPVPWEEIEPILQEYVGDVDEVFEIFEKEPIAAASIGQVYRAVLKTGEVVAVKVQRPGIVEQIHTDMLILESMAKRVERLFPDYRVYNPTGMVKDFSIQIKRELDFSREGKNADHFSHNFKDFPGVKFPKIYWDYSGKRVLVMEFVEGVRADNVETIKTMGFDTVAIADRGFSAFLQMIFRDGFFHQDPHPGNLRVTPKGELAFLDFGEVGVIRPERQDVFIKLILSITDGDVNTLVDCFEKLGVQFRPDDLDEVKDELFFMLQDASGGSEIKDYDVGGAIGSIPEVLNKYHIAVPQSLFALLKVIVMILGIGMELDPNFNFSDKARPYLGQVVHDRLFSASGLKKSTASIFDGFENIMSIPSILNRTLSKIQAGQMKIDIAVSEVEDVARTIEEASDKFLVGVIGGAMVLSAGIVVHASDVPIEGVIFWIAILGYFIAILIGIFALYRVMKGKK